MGKHGLVCIVLIATGLLACGLGMNLVSENNLRFETIKYDGFTVSVSAGGKVGARKTIALYVWPRREITIQADRMRVYFRDTRIGYDILDDGKPTDKKAFKLFRGEKIIVYRLEVDGVFARNDSLLFFAPGIFHAGEHFNDLDTMVFKIAR